MVVCFHVPRFELVLAAGRAGALAGRALAIAPLPGCEQCVAVWERAAARQQQADLQA